VENHKNGRGKKFRQGGKNRQGKGSRRQVYMSTWKEQKEIRPTFDSVQKWRKKKGKVGGERGGNQSSTKPIKKTKKPTDP